VSLIDLSLEAPKVSVVCAWYNRAAFIRDTIDSLLAQDYPNFEVIVVNDGSTDPCVQEIFDSYDDSRLRVIHQVNMGFVRAIHRAITEATGEFVAVQGSGDRSLPGRLSAQACLLRDNPGIVIAGSDILEEYRDTNGKILRTKEKKSPKFKVNKGSFIKKNPLSHGEVMYRKSDYMNTRGYRPFFKRAQDVDLWLSMLDFGDIGFCSQFLYLRRNFLADGISSSSHSVAISQRYSEIAIRCSEEREWGGRDLVDIHGENAIYFAGRSPRLADFFGRLAIKLLIEESFEASERLGVLALRQARTRVSLFSYIVTRKASKIRWRRILLKKIFLNKIVNGLDLSSDKF
jgi:glycosyltransferase involved in cell wall biosynthesis